MMTKKNITIYDVASAAGVSKTTVSRYLNNRTDLMSEKTRARIEKVINILDYHPSELARSLKSKRTHTIGVIVSEIRSPFFSAIISGIEEVLFERGYSAIFMDCGNDKEKEKRYIRETLSRDVEGIIINTTSIINDYLVSLDIQKVPIVLCDRYVSNHKLDIVTIDNEKLTNDIFNHLLEQGFNRFAFFTEPWKENSSRLNRRHYFLKIIKERLGYDASRDVYTIGVDYKNGEEALNAFAKTFGANDVPVIIGVNSVTTFEAYLAIQKRKMKIPQDIGICGPDDWNWENYMSWPDITGTPVTTIEFETKLLGRKCAEILLDRINNPQKEMEEIKIPAELKIRQSTTRKEK